PDRPGTPRPPGRQHHDDLHACAQPGTGWRPEPRRPYVLVMTSGAGNILPLRATIPEGNTVGQPADVDVGPSHRAPGLRAPGLSRGRGAVRGLAAPVVLPASAGRELSCP